MVGKALALQGGVSVRLFAHPQFQERIARTLVGQRIVLGMVKDGRTKFIGVANDADELIGLFPMDHPVADQLLGGAQYSANVSEIVPGTSGRRFDAVVIMVRAAPTELTAIVPRAVRGDVELDAVVTSRRARMVLDVLDQNGGNDLLIADILAALGVPTAMAALHSLLDRLRDDGLITSEDVEVSGALKARVSALTRLGKDVQLGRDRRDWIAIGSRHE